VLEKQLKAGRVPNLARWLHSGGMTLDRWAPLLPTQTSASQAGVLHGNNDGIPGFRWWDKKTQRLMVSNHPKDAREIERRGADRITRAAWLSLSARARGDERAAAPSEHRARDRGDVATHVPDLCRLRRLRRDRAPRRSRECRGARRDRWPRQDHRDHRDGRRGRAAAVSLCRALRPWAESRRDVRAALSQAARNARPGPRRRARQGAGRDRTRRALGEAQPAPVGSVGY